MDFQIRPGTDHDLDELVRLSLLAWAPVFESFAQVLGPAIYAKIYPDWHAQQSETVRTYCAAREDRTLLVAEADGVVAGFLAYEVNHTSKTGEIQLLAVHPDYQDRGIGTALNKAALAGMKAGGMQLAEVGTGGDPGHAPARRCYEKAGFTPLPLVRYYQDLS
jgi:ribosomal protein S18 acetylase RimI-like enzyme